MHLLEKTNVKDVELVLGSLMEEMKTIETALQMLHEAYEDWLVDHQDDLRAQAALCVQVRIFKNLMMAVAKSINELHDKQIERDMPNCFRNVNAGKPMKSRVNSITIESGRLTLTQRRSWTVIDRLKMYEWLKKNGMGLLVQPYVQPLTLSAALNDYSKEKGEEPPPEIVKPQSHTQVSITLKGEPKFKEEK